MANESAYRTGTITAGHDTTTLTADLSEAATANDMVGRVVYLTGNNYAQGRYRRITANGASSGDNNSTSITIANAFGGSALRGLTPNFTHATNGDATAELAATASNTFSISKPLSECNSTDISDITADDADFSTYRQITSTANDNADFWNLQTGCVVYDEDITFQMVSSWADGSNSGDRREKIRLNNDTALIFGRQNFGDTDNDEIIGWTSHSCNIYDRANGLGQGTTDTRGAVHFNGGEFRATQITTASDGWNSDANTGRGPFYRPYDSTGGGWRMWNTTCYGVWGVRVDHSYSVFYNTTIIGNDSFFGPVGPLSEVGVLENVFIKDGQFGVYNYPQAAGSSSIGPMDFQSLTTAVIYLNSNSANSETTTLQDWNFTNVNEATAPATVDLLEATGGDSSTQTYRFQKNFKLDFSEASGAVIPDSEDAIVGFENGIQSTFTQTSNGGDVPVQNLRAYDLSIAGNISDANNPTGLDDNRVLNYIGGGVVWAAYYRNYNILSGTTTLDGPLGILNGISTRSVDNTITETDTDIVDAYTELETAAKVYDFQGFFKHNTSNIGLPTLTTLPFGREGEVLTVSNTRTDVTFESGHSGDFTVTESVEDAETTVAINWVGTGDFTADNQLAIRSTENDLTSDGAIADSHWGNYQNAYLYLRLDTQENSRQFLDDCVEIGYIDVRIDDATSEGRYELTSDASNFSDDGAYVQLGRRLSSTSTPGSIDDNALHDRFLKHDGFLTWLVTIDGGDNGYSEGIDIGTRTLIIDNTLRGEITAGQITLTGISDEGDIINTNSSISTDTGATDNGLLVESTGDPTYFIRGGADVSGAKISRAGSGEVEIILADTTGNAPVVGTGVTLRKNVTVTINLGDSVSYDSTLLRRFRWAEAADLDSYSSATKNDVTDDAVAVDGDTVGEVTYTFTVDPTNDVYLFWAYDGYENERFINIDSSADRTATTIAATSINFSTTPGDGTDDETLNNKINTDSTYSVGRNTDYDAFTSATDEIHVRLNHTGGLDISGNFARKWFWNVMNQPQWADGVIEGYIPNNLFSFSSTSTIVELNNTDDDRITGGDNAGFITKTSNANDVVTLNTRILNQVNADLRTDITTSASNATKIDFSINASGASGNEVLGIVESILDDRDMTKTNQERLGKLQPIETS